MLAVVVLIALSILIATGDKGEAYRLPLLAVLAVATIFAVVAFLSSFYEPLAGAKTALGLPDGSVRALLAFSLVVLFGVMTLFCLVRLTDPISLPAADESVAEQKKTPTPKDAAAQTAIVAALQIPAPVPSASPNSAGTKEQTGGETKSNTTASTTPARVTPLDIINARQQSAIDLAKQLLTMLGTLLASVASFYFGASTSASANDPAKLAAAAKAIKDATT
ncbi:MAG TPA: hypothetical protein VJ276_02530 [Thermoanaerobaculia bacterium]|nr:hypothetical protein [Thermoanaerobaculia bacterium]